MVPRASLALGLILGLTSCSSPSSEVRGDDLLGVFDADAGARDGGVAPPVGSARPRGSASAAGSGSGAFAAPRPPLAPRVPEGDACFESSGQPATPTRTLGRPACRGSEVLETRDPAGSPRYACLFVAPDEVKGAAPLVVFFHGDGPTLDAPTAVHKQTSLRALQGKMSLGGQEKGFHILAIQGRALPGSATASFDVHHVGADNLDIVTTNHFVDVLQARKLVDPRRIYALGLGSGGTMAATWAMVSADRVAAFASLAADPPTAAWSCPGPPPPGVVLYRACDAITSCDGVERYLEGREAARAETRAFRLGDDAKEVLNCEPKNACGKKRGTAAHSRWSKALEKPILTFFSEHALAVPSP